VSWLLWAVATVEFRQDPLAGLFWWWARISTTAMDARRQFRDDARATPRGVTPGRHRYLIDVVIQVLLASALAQSHRKIGADLGVPADTMHGSIRRAASADWLRVQATISALNFDPILPATVQLALCWLSRVRVRNGRGGPGTSARPDRTAMPAGGFLRPRND
jgi:hypothetical protein